MPAYSGVDPGGILGEVYSIEGRALKAVMIELRRVGAEVRDTGVLTDSTGLFKISGVAPGEYMLTGRTIGYYAQADSIAVHEGYVVRICMVLTEAIVPIRG